MTTNPDTAAVQQTASDLLNAPSRDVLFWSGAGISGDPPTSAPLGYTLTDRALAQAFEGELLLQRLRAAYTALGLRRDRPRLETVLDVVAAEHGLDAVATLLADLQDPPPNGNHAFFAEHTCRGGRHVTANFDTCIERAGGEPTRMIHFHGALTPSGDVSELGARLTGIERGFTTRQRDQLDDALRDTRLLVVVGYSGLDYFDVDPYWRQAANDGLFVGRRVVWVNHASTWSITSGEACTRKQLRVMADDGRADVHEVNAPTRDLLNLLAEAWDIDSIPAPPAATKQDLPPLTADAAARDRATTRFLVTSGLRTEVRSRLSRHNLTSEAHAWAAEAAWAAGQYREAAQHWNDAHPGTDPASAATRGERQAACLWLRGRLRASRELCLQTLHDARRAEVDPLQRLLIAETLARILAHMTRLPDTRLLVTCSWRQAALNALNEAEQAITDTADGRELPVHVRNRVASARADLLPTREQGTRAVHEDRAAGPIRDFDESEALGAMLNYQHANLRTRIEDPQPGDGGPPTRAEYLSHRDRFLALGDTADAARVPLLPGAAHAFPVRTVIRDLTGCDYTRYHLMRLIAVHLLQRIRERKRQAHEKANPPSSSPQTAETQVR